MVRSGWMGGAGMVLLVVLGGGCGSSLSESTKLACKYDRECLATCAKGQSDQAFQEYCQVLIRSINAPPPVVASPAKARSQRSVIETVGRSMEPLTAAAIASRSLQSIVVVKTDTGLGSGFAVAKARQVVTNLHVVAGATKIQAFLVNGEPLEVQGVLGWDTVNDLAVLQIEEGLPILTLAKAAPNVGDPVVAIGNPLGFAATVSNGIVSAFRTDAASVLMQISAPIAPGSSGGPVIDDHGQVVGVAVATIRGGQNLNFAVPAKYVAALLAGEELKTIEAFGAATRKAPKAVEELPAAPSFAGCSGADKKYLATTLREAVDTGGALCSSGKGTACFHVYEGAAQDAEKAISSACAGPRAALAGARSAAGTLPEAGEKAHLLERTVKSVALGAAQ